MFFNVKLQRLCKYHHLQCIIVVSVGYPTKVFGLVPYMHRDFSSFSESFDEVMHCRWWHLQSLCNCFECFETCSRRQIWKKLILCIKLYTFSVLTLSCYLCSIVYKILAHVIWNYFSFFIILFKFKKRPNISVIRVVAFFVLLCSSQNMFNWLKMLCVSAVIKWISLILIQ